MEVYRFGPSKPYRVTRAPELAGRGRNITNNGADFRHWNDCLECRFCRRTVPSMRGRVAMLDRSASSSTSRRPSEITDWLLRHPPQRQPDRDRGLWRFLTWPFFLAQVMIAGPFLGSGAQAALE